jgi:hypothetical protein
MDHSLCVLVGLRIDAFAKEYGIPSAQADVLKHTVRADFENADCHPEVVSAAVRELSEEYFPPQARRT